MQDEVGDRHPSPKMEDDVGGVSKVGDEGLSDAVCEEAHMGEETAEGDVAGEEREAGVGDGGRRSSTLVQQIKQRGRRRKVAAVRLSPYTSPRSRCYGVGRRRGTVAATFSRRGRARSGGRPVVEGNEDVLNVPLSATATTDMPPTGSAV